MDFSKLSANEKLATYGAVAAIVGSILSLATGTGSFGLLTGIVMLVIIFLPQFSPSTKLPGSKGSLMLIVGGVAALLMAYVLLSTFSFTFEGFDLSSLLFLVAVAGAIVMGWAGWQAFQAEGGKFNVGMAAEPFVPPPSAPPPAMTPPPSAPPAETDRTEDDTRP